MKKMLKKLLLIFSLVGFAVVAFAIAAGYLVFFENKPPHIYINDTVQYIGAQKSIRITAVDADCGLRRLRVSITQNEKQHTLLEEDMPFAGLLSREQIITKTAVIDLAPCRLGLRNGKAVLEITVRDFSFTNWGNGNTATLTQELIIDTVPPAIAVIANTRYLSQGGSGVVIYRVSKPAAFQGVKVADTFFEGYPVAAMPGLYQALFALPWNSPSVRLSVQARDLAGNTAEALFPFEIKPKKFRTDTISLTEASLQAVSARAAEQFPDYLDTASPVATFIAVNTRLRTANEAEFQRSCSVSKTERLWQGGFTPLPNASVRARFGDQRAYVRNRQEVSASVHLGLDMASVAHAPVPAANDGFVAENKKMGIYGLTIILDHGLGLFSTYSHLSSTAVQKGERVVKGQTIARTGSTGLAFGDHLHFGMAIQGCFVNPAEWIDPLWITQKIELPLAEALQK
jgi:murein DD-endopeptidase MepM/ murein hydrolase activator NlpD